ncbi:hypothetical protein D3273_25245 [Lichenibacterium minor]|uniref:DUF6894 domain-containing protein n=1 Tax=Lichenibacterium minor TaxID=2316528 RepID=A0A4Q2U3C7_9HYPH|nr:hypothetical protein D3273_25245 [Lichenibacterium minor]
MPRYYFDIHDAKGFHPDEFGEALADLEEARDQAQLLLPDIMREELPNRKRRSAPTFWSLTG